MGSSAALDTDPEKLKAMFDVNVVGPLRMVQGFASALAKAAKSGSRAKVLNIGTVLSGGAPWHTGYASSKVSRSSFVNVYVLIERQHYKS
jgi:NAD(P)-dependent dehydrogenase (short-subunit alcohol dehydrogenase family)